MSQIEFSSKLGITYRAYQNKVYGKVDWKLDEIIKIAEMNDGEVEVNDYQIKVFSKVYK